LRENVEVRGARPGPCCADGQGTGRR
jgi:hypothetical protein